MHYKVRVKDSVENRAFYKIIGITQTGHKELIGMYILESESSEYWLTVLTDLQNRVLKDILIACADNLKGFSQAISSVFSNTHIYKSIIHQIHNSLIYVTSKDQKSFLKDLKLVYKAVNIKEAKRFLDELDEKWSTKYSIVIKI